MTGLSPLQIAHGERLPSKEDHYEGGGSTQEIVLMPMSNPEWKETPDSQAWAEDKRDHWQTATPL
jgi:hypothetical protein